MHKVKLVTEILKEFPQYIIIEAEAIRFDYCGCHHTGYDAIDTSGEYWGVFETEEGYLFLAR